MGKKMRFEGNKWFSKKPFMNDFLHSKTKEFDKSGNHNRFD